jgi:hypothetical protein
VTDTLNNITAWVGLLTVLLTLGLFLLDRASQKNLLLPGLNIKKSQLSGTANKKKSFFAARLTARDVKKNLSLFHVRQICGIKRDFSFSLAGNW